MRNNLKVSNIQKDKQTNKQIKWNNLKVSNIQKDKQTNKQTNEKQLKSIKHIERQTDK